MDKIEFRRGDSVRFNPADPEMDRDDNAIVVDVDPNDELPNVIIQLSNGKIEHAFPDELKFLKFYEPKKQAASDPVDHPAHYNVGKYECIDLIKFVTTLVTNDLIPEKDKAYAGHLLGTWIKYLFRAPFKENPVQDHEKSDYYIGKLMDLVGWKIEN